MTWRETRPNEYIRYDVARSYLHNACQYIGSNGGLELKCRFDHEKTTTVPQWIPCSERLPEVGQSVLISVGGMYTAEGCLREDGNWAQFRWDAVQRKDMVGAWQPLPAPYEGG